MQKAKVIQELRREHNLVTLLEIAQLPKATFYYHGKNKAKKTGMSRQRQKLQQSSMRIRADTDIAVSQMSCVTVDLA